jgi:hypothetical protein
MQTRLHLSSNPNVVRVAELRRESESTSTLPALDTVAPLARAEPPASVRIRQARQLLEHLVLEDEFESDNGLLLGAVAESLNEMLLELDHLAGLNRMFELWVKDAP